MSVVLGPPSTLAKPLAHRPQVLSWDKAGAWSQERLKPYKAEIGELFQGQLGAGGLSVDLSCGLGPTNNLEAAGDLDNYLSPVVDVFGWSAVVSAWASKNPGRISAIAVGEPTDIRLEPTQGWCHAHVRTTRSASSTAWKEEIGSQLSGVKPLPATGFAELVLNFAVCPRRNWGYLWKPAIDAAGQILGPGPRHWHPRDGRITRLGLCLHVDPIREWDVEIDYWWRAAS